MAYEIIRPNFQLPVRPASNIQPRAAVKLVGSNALRLAMVASSNDRPFGYIGEATAPNSSSGSDGHDSFVGVAQVIEEGNIVKAIAGASFGAGAVLTVATVGIATVAQGGAYVATVTQLGPITYASGSIQWEHGIALDAGSPGGLFTLYVKPRQSGGLA